MPNNRPRLTVAIPTFDRNDRLLQTLTDLLPQMMASCDLLVIDNASAVAVSETLASLLAEYPGVRVRILRNDVNIGGNANICRCIELAEGSYLWILSDDDRVLANAVSTIFAMLDDFSGAAMINFSSQIHMRKSQILCHGIDDFVAKIDNFSNILFLSTSIYNANNLRFQLRFAFQHCYSLAPHFAALLMSLDAMPNCVLSEKQIVGWESDQDQQSWSVVSLALGVMTVLELPLKSTTRVLLAEKIAAACSPPDALFFQLLKQELSTGEHAAARFYYDHLRYRLAYFEHNWRRRAAFGLYRILLDVPLISIRLLRLSSRLLGRPTVKSLGTLESLDRL
jgi:glycosyltransferase involved in cell wall biosynthesis